MTALPTFACMADLGAKDKIEEITHKQLDVPIDVTFVIVAVHAP